MHMAIDEYNMVQKTNLFMVYVENIGLETIYWLLILPLILMIVALFQTC